MSGTVREAPRSNGHGLFPVTYSILAEDALLGTVAREYPIEAPLECRLLRPGLNDTFLVTTRSAPYVLRVYRTPWRTASDVGYELDLLEHLARRGISVARPVAAADGSLMRTVRAPEGERQLVLFAFAEGKPLSWEDERQSRLAGRVAASLHTAADDFVSVRQRSELDLEYLVERPLAAIRRFLDHEDERFLDDLGRELRERVEQAVAGGLDWGVCHGDLAAKNITVDDDGRLTVFDFDLCGPGWRAYDIAAAPYYALYEHNRECWESFLSGYDEVRTLPAADLGAVPLFHVVNRLWSFGLYALNAPRWGTLPMRRDYADAQLAFFRRWRDGDERGNGAGHGKQAARRAAAVDVVYSIVAGDAVGEELAAGWPIGGSVDCRLLNRGLNDHYLVRTPAERYVARLYRAGWRSDDDVAYELGLLQHVAAKGVAVAEPVARGDGRLASTLAAPEGARQLVLLGYAEGEPPPWDEEHGYEAGRAAASFHAAGDGFVSAHGRFRLDLDYLLDEPLLLIRPFLDGRPADRADLDRIAERLRAGIEASAAGLDWGPCHGDLNVKNMHLAADGTTTLFDFDFCGPGWRAYDLAAGPFYATYQGRLPLWDAFVRGYREVRGLEDADVAAVPLLHAASRIWSTGLKAAKVGEAGIQRMSGWYLDRLLSFLRPFELDHLGRER